MAQTEMSGNAGAVHRNRADAPGQVKSAQRVIDVLNLLGHYEGSRTHAQIAEELAIPKSSLSQILHTLASARYVELDTRTRGYSLGPSITELSHATGLRRGLVEAASGVLERLTEQTGESSALNLRDGDDMRVAATVLGPNRIVAHLRLDDRAPLHATSGGQVMLAFLANATREDYLSRVRLKRYARNSLVDVASLRRKLDDIAEKRYAVVEEEYTPGIGGISCPLTANGKLVGSLGITIPMQRFTEDLKATALGALDAAAKSIHHRFDASACSGLQDTK